MHVIRYIGIITSFLMFLIFSYILYDINDLSYDSKKGGLPENLIGVGLILASLIQLVFLILTIKFTTKIYYSKLGDQNILDSLVYPEKNTLPPEKFIYLKIWAFLGSVVYLILIIISLKSNYRKFTKIQFSFDSVPLRILVVNILMLLTVLAVFYVLSFLRRQRKN